MSKPFTDNASQSRYELDVEGQIVFADYRKEDDVVYIIHVEAPKALRGKGAAGEFMRAMMEHLRAENRKMFPICSYAAAWVGRNREFQDLVVGH